MNKKISKYKNHLTDIFLILIIALLILFFSYSSKSFMSVSQWINLLNMVSYRLIISLSMCFIFASGGIDLSVSSIISLSSIILAIMIKKSINFPLALILTTFIIGIFSGINGFIINKTKINAFIITLASSSIYSGIGLILTKGVPISRFPKEILKFGISNSFFSASVIIAIIFLVFSIFIGYCTKWGLYIRMIGSNEQNLKRTGVNTLPYHVFVYILMGISSVLVALILMTKLNSAEVNLGGNLGLDAITAVILGGATLKGGEFNIFGTILAVFLLSIIRVGLTATSVTSYYQDLVIGIILMLAVLISNLWNKNKI